MSQVQDHKKDIHIAWPTHIYVYIDINIYTNIYLWMHAYMHTHIVYTVHTHLPLPGKLS